MGKFGGAGGIEPPTSCLQSRRSPTELRPHERGYMRSKVTVQGFSGGSNSCQEGVEGTAAVADGVLLGGGHLAKGQIAPSGTKIGS